MPSKVCEPRITAATVITTKCNFGSDNSFYYLGELHLNFFNGLYDTDRNKLHIVFLGNMEDAKYDEALIY